MQAPPEHVGVWSEFVPSREAQRHLPALAAHGAELYLALREGELDEDTWALLAASREAGVPVRAWLQIPDAGTWLNETNIGDFRRFSDRLLTDAAGRGLSPEWIILDIEPALMLGEALRRAATSGDLPSLVELLADQYDPAAFAQAARELAGMVDELHVRGVRVMAVTLPWVVDDAVDEDTDIQDLLNMPVRGVDWDEVSVIVYRPVLEEYLGGVSLSSSVVQRYAIAAQRYFGNRVELALGNIGSPGLLVPAGYTDPADLTADLAAARSAAITRVSVFSQDGMIEQGGVSRWLDAMARPTQPSYALWSAVDPIRRMIELADRVGVPLALWLP